MFRASDGCDTDVVGFAYGGGEGAQGEGLSEALSWLHGMRFTNIWQDLSRSKGVIG